MATVLRYGSRKVDDLMICIGDELLHIRSNFSIPIDFFPLSKSRQQLLDMIHMVFKLVVILGLVHHDLDSHKPMHMNSMYMYAALTMSRIDIVCHPISA